MILLPYLMSFVTGALLLSRMMERPQRLSLFWAPAAFSLGLGCSALLSFYSLLIWNAFYLPGIIGLHLLTWLALSVHKGIPRREPGTLLMTWGTFLASLWPIWLAAAVIIHFFYTLSTHHPFGEWDAWAVWNLKTIFLLEAGNNWKDIFTLHWHTQPDYPLLLPALNAWVSAAASVPVPIAGQWTAVLLSANTVLLLFAGLQRYTGYLPALTAALLLATTPTFTFLGTSQYADILLAHYLLLAMVLMTMLIRENDKDLAPLLGAALGLLCFSKNEGIIIALILISILLKYFVNQKKMLKYILSAFAVAAAAAVIFKLALAPANRDMNLSQLAMLPSLFNFERCLLIFKHTVMNIFERQWNFLWVLLLGLFLADTKKYIRQETRAALVFFLLYAGVLFIIYLTTAGFDLQWRLSRTAARILFYMLPSVLFVSFDTHWRIR